MGNIDSKIGEGLSSIHGGLEQSKIKLQTAQEVSRLKKSLKEQSSTKAKKLYELAEICHQMIREKKITDPELLKISNEILEYDKVIFDIGNKMIALTPEPSKTITCSCGSKIEKEDKFCGDCGKPAEKEQLQEINLWITCKTCEFETPENSKFCRCCGAMILE